MARFRISPFIKDVLLTTIVSIVEIIAVLFITRLLALDLGPDGFGLYSFARRIIAFAFPFAVLSIGVALTRYVAISVEKEEQEGYLVSAIVIISCGALLFIGTGYLFGHQLTILIFQDAKHLMLFYGMLSMIIGLCYSDTLYSYYRGIQRMDLANLWQLCNGSIFPTAIVFFFSKTQNVSLILFLFAASAFLSLIPLTLLIRRLQFPSQAVLGLSAKTLLLYSVPRIPGGIGLNALFLIGPFLASYFGTMKDVAFLAVGQSVLRIVGASVTSFGLVVLPRASQIVTQGEINFLKDRIKDIIELSIHMGLFVVIQVFIWTDSFVSIWLGPDYSVAAPIVRIFLISLAPYLCYVLLRSIIDAVETKAVNTFNIYVSFGVTAILSTLFVYLGMGIWSLALCVVVGISILGFSTVYYLKRRYEISFFNIIPFQVLLANVIMAVISIITKNQLTEGLNNFYLLVMIMVLEMSLFTVYTVFLYKKKVRWVIELKTRVISKIK